MEQEVDLMMSLALVTKASFAHPHELSDANLQARFFQEFSSQGLSCSLSKLNVTAWEVKVTAPFATAEQVHPIELHDSARNYLDMLGHQYIVRE